MKCLMFVLLVQSDVPSPSNLQVRLTLHRGLPVCVTASITLLLEHHQVEVLELSTSLEMYFTVAYVSK